MTIDQLLAQHAETMNSMTTKNMEEVQANSAKLREVIGDPYAAYRFNRSLGESDKPESEQTTAVSGTQPVAGAS